MFPTETLFCPKRLNLGCKLKDFDYAIPGLKSQEQISGVKRAKLCFFLTKKEAQEFLREQYDDINETARENGGQSNKGTDINLSRNRIPDTTVIPGIRLDWPEAQERISGVKGAKLCSFLTKKEAQEFMREQYDDIDETARENGGKSNKGTDMNISANQIPHIIIRQGKKYELFCNLIGSHFYPLTSCHVDCPFMAHS